MRDQSASGDPIPSGSAKEGLHVDFVTVEELYAGSYTFNLPWFQRAYAWTDDLALRLLDDICQAHTDRASRYFIGHVLLARKPGETHHSLVDGQQRAVTLMILFALLRHRLADTEWEARIAPLLEAGIGSDGIRYRLAPQPVFEKFFRDHIQSKGAMAAPVDDFGASQVESNLLNNRVCLDERLTKFVEEGGDIAALAEFVLTRCLMVLEVVSSVSENEAWQMLQTEENTGLPFHNGARAKVSLIEAMPADEREFAGKLWDKYQAQLGDDGMQQLITHIRDLSGRKRSSQPVEKDIIMRFQLNTRGPAFMREHLVPSAERLVALRNYQVGSSDGDQREIARYLRHMQWAGHVYWCPAGMRWLERNGASHLDTISFFRLLARKVWILRISGADSVEYERRFIALCNEIADGRDLNQMTELAVPQKLLDKARENLLSRTFYDKRYSRPVLRYLSDLLGDDPGEVDGDLITVEHVLPQSPGGRSRWLKEFRSVKEISNYAHRIGNLAFLSFKDNQHVGNQEYAEKRDVLKKSGFILSTEAASAQEWTAGHILNRSDLLVGVIFDHWELQL